MRRVVLFIALRQLWARKTLNGIAALGVALGVVVLIVIHGILQGFQRKFLDNIQRISPHVTMLDKELRPPRSLLSLALGPELVAQVAHEVPSERAARIRRPREITRALRSLPGVVAASGSLVGSAVLGYGSQQLAVDVRGVEPLAQDEVTPISRYVIAGDYRQLAAGGGVLLGRGVAERIGAHLGDHITLGSPRGQTLQLEVIGSFDCDIPQVNKVRVYAALRDAQRVLGKPDTTDRIEVRLASAPRAQGVAAQLEAMFGYDAESWQEQNANYLSLFAQQNTIIGFVVGAILAVGGFGILAIQVMIVLEKTRDIALLRSVGFSRRDILSGFLLQGIIISLIGAGLGELAGHYLLVLLSHMRTRQEGLVKSETFLVYDDPNFYLYGVAFALVIGVVASLLPAYRGARVEPVDVLRGQIG